MNQWIKKRATILLSVLLVAIIAIGGTTAYLFAQTNTAENVFTFSDNIKGHLDEPSWNPEDGENLYPGLKIDKDPRITNTSVNFIDEYASIRLTFTNGAGSTLSGEDTARLLNLIEIDWSGNWTLIDGLITEEAGVITAVTQPLIYSFNEKISQGVETDPLFYSVTIKDISPDDLAWLAGVYNHDDSCYLFGAHDDGECTVTYRHHERCAIYGMPGAENVPAGGALDQTDCDCEASEIHERSCPSLIGVLDPDCQHTLQGGLGGFNIIVQGGVVQADAFLGYPGDPAQSADSRQALIDVFSASNP